MVTIDRHRRSLESGKDRKGCHFYEVLYDKFECRWKSIELLHQCFLEDGYGCASLYYTLSCCIAMNRMTTFFLDRPKGSGELQEDISRAGSHENETASSSTPLLEGVRPDMFDTTPDATTFLGSPAPQDTHAEDTLNKPVDTTGDLSGQARDSSRASSPKFETTPPATTSNPEPPSFLG